MSRWHLVARHAAQTEMLAWLGCTALDGERLLAVLAGALFVSSRFIVSAATGGAKREADLFAAAALV